MRWLIGVDEAGRGALAGPVAVGAILVPQEFDWRLIPGVNDSKKIREKEREHIFKLTKALKSNGELDYHVSLINSRLIDKIGIVPAIRLGLGRCLENLRARGGFTYQEVYVKLDGSLKAPLSYLHQQTIIKGDSKELCIGLASILAKVTRDRHMVRLGKKLPVYDFAIHKGYGTKSHRELIRIHGLSSEHRQTFCSNLLK